MPSPRQKSIQQNALGWVKKSIDDSLETSESDLKLYIENRDSALIVDVINRLQTLQGVLLMVEQFGAAMLTEEMVSLAQYIESNTEDKSDAALEVLMRAVLQLPDYLEHIQSGQQDIPIIILPILNDIRAVRDQDLFSDKLLFLPDLSMHQDASEADDITAEQNQATKLLIKKLRPTFQVALLNLIKEQSIEGSLKHMTRIFETLEEKASSEQMARIWWVVGAMIESLSRQQIELGVSVKNLLGKVDALFREMLIIGEQGLLRRQPVDLIKNFLFYIGQPECDGPKAQAIKTAYRLEQFLPTEAARVQALQKISGPNQALLKTVAEAIKGDIETVKAVLEVYVNSDLSDFDELKALPDDLRVISDTLAMIGLGPQRQLIKEQIEIVEQILSGESQASDAQILTIAEDLLQVEQALDHLQRSRIPEAVDTVEADVNEAEYAMDDVLVSVVTAALDNIQRTKDAILDFIQDSSDDEKIKSCVPLLEETRGAMRMLDQHRSQGVLDNLVKYLVNSDILDFMEASRLDALSQVVASIEYYLEALGEHRTDAENILQFAEVQMENLLVGIRIDESQADKAVDLEVVEETQETAAIEDLETALQVDDDSLDEVSVEDQVEDEFLSAAELSEVLDGDATEAVDMESDVPDEPSMDIELTEEASVDSVELAEAPAESESESESGSGSFATDEMVDVEIEDDVTDNSQFAEVDDSDSGDSFAPSHGEPVEVAAGEFGEAESTDDGFEAGIVEDGSAIDSAEPADEIELSVDATGGNDFSAVEMPGGTPEPTLSEDKSPELDVLGDLSDELQEEIDVTELPGDLDWQAVEIEPSEADQSEPGVDTNGDMTGDNELRIDFDDETLEQAAEQAILEPHDEFASPMDLLAEQAGHLEATPGEDHLLAEEENALDEISEQDASVENITVTASDADEASGMAESISATALAEQESEPEPEPEPEPLAAGSAAPISAQLQVVPVTGDEIVLKPGVDQEILEIYLEEADEESQNIRDSHRQWAEDHDDHDALLTIRRAFHTIKGSGRLVGAVKIGEFAWDFENLLNRVIDRSLPVSEAIINAVGQAGQALGELVIELQGGDSPTSDIAYLRGLARALLDADAAALLSPPDADAQPAAEMPATIEPGSLDDLAAATLSEAQDEPPTEVSSSGVFESSNGEPHDPLVEATSSPRPENGAGEGLPTSPELTEETGLSFDPDLLKIYQQEVEQHLSTLNTALKQAQAVGELIPTEPLYRCLHTIHGASRTADIGTLAELAALMEKPMKSAASQKLALDAEAIELFGEGHQALHDLTEQLVQTRQLPEIPEALRDRLQAYADDIEEHTVEVPEDQAPSGNFVDTLSMMSEQEEDEQDNELLMIFIDEANELLEISDSTFDHWIGNQNTSDFSEVMELQRYLHTLKGGARMASLHEISDLSHEMESVFIAVIDGRLPRGEELVQTLRASFDLLHSQVDAAENNSALPDPVNYIDNMKRLRLGEERSTPEPAVSSGAENRREHKDTDLSDQGELEHATPEQPARDVVRVRSELLDNLVNSAGEASIYRARMEQQVSGLGSYLGELGQTISRLQHQLRDLESETEAQIHYSHREEGPQSPEFDPLEMDRYTMIQELSRSLSESVNDLSSLQNMLGDQVKESETLLLQQSRVNSELQEGLVKSRMVRFSGLVSRLRRLVRQSSQELGKKAELVVSGEEHEVDNKVLDRMVAPLEHLLRNAVSHGIETPMERVKKSKAEAGIITINISRDGSDIVIEVLDDGAGIDIEKVRQRALSLGLINEPGQMTDAELIRLILQPGFSTAAQVTQMAGRGVGMDVVEVEIKHLGGSLQIESTPAGSRFIMRLPFTLSINRAILVKADEENYAIPLINIEGVARLDPERLLDAYQLATPQLEYVDQTFSLHYLAKLVGTAPHYRGSHGDPRQSVIFCRAGDSRLALHVDELIGNREIVVKSLGKQLGQVKSISGASILADGSVVLILDIGGLIELYTENLVSVVYHGQDEDEQAMQRTIMVVDDSITMRRVATKLLQRHDYQVITAKDGMDALTQLEEVQPDLMLLDIEMPKMDGFELASHMKNESALRDIPIIMITSRTGEKHRQRASEIGVDDYMGKPYQEEELLANIKSIFGSR